MSNYQQTVILSRRRRIYLNSHLEEIHILARCFLILNTGIGSFGVLDSLIKLNPVNPVDPVKKNIVKNGALAQTLIMQNEPNLKTTPIAVSLFRRRTTNSERRSAEGKNEPKTNPNEPTVTPASSRGKSPKRPSAGNKSVQSPDNRTDFIYSWLHMQKKILYMVSIRSSTIVQSPAPAAIGHRCPENT